MFDFAQTLRVSLICVLVVSSGCQFLHLHSRDKNTWPAKLVRVNPVTVPC